MSTNKIKIQVIINKEKHPELWKQLKDISPKNRAEVLRRFAWLGIIKKETNHEVKNIKNKIPNSEQNKNIIKKMNF